MPAIPIQSIPAAAGQKSHFACGELQKLSPRYGFIPNLCPAEFLPVKT
jgi:hypothetical protein